MAQLTSVDPASAHAMRRRLVNMIWRRGRTTDTGKRLATVIIRSARPRKAVRVPPVKEAAAVGVPSASWCESTTELMRLGIGFRGLSAVRLLADRKSGYGARDSGKNAPHRDSPANFKACCRFGASCDRQPAPGSIDWVSPPAATRWAWQEWPSGYRCPVRLLV